MRGWTAAAADTSVLSPTEAADVIASVFDDRS
jgi:hypothetical protein